MERLPQVIILQAAMSTRVVHGDEMPQLILKGKAPRTTTEFVVTALTDMSQVRDSFRYCLAIF
jgi:hypothetical protein